MGLLNRSKGDALFDSNISYSTGDRLLFDVRRYMRALVALHVIFVSIIVITFGLVWHQISQYDLIKPENLNTVNEYVVNTISNADLMSTQAVPIVSSLQYVSVALAAAVQAMTNATDKQLEGRHLLQITQDSILHEDYNMRKMIYKQVRTLLDEANGRLADWNVSAVNSLISATADQVQNVNFTGVAERYDRTLADIEAASHFGVLATSMLGLAAAATNTTLPSPSALLEMYTSQKAAVVLPVGVGGVPSCK
jgi:hypothetical protein